MIFVLSVYYQLWGRWRGEATMTMTGCFWDLPMGALA